MAGTQYRQLPGLFLAGTSAGAFTTPIGGLDDALAITLWMVSTAAATSTGAILGLQVSMFDPSQASSAEERGVIQSTNYHALSSLIFSTGAGLVTSSGISITLALNTIGAWRGLRMAGLSSGTAGERIAFISKTIWV